MAKKDNLEILKILQEVYKKDLKTGKQSMHYSFGEEQIGDYFPIIFMVNVKNFEEILDQLGLSKKS